ncbi:adhesin [Ectobacillus sp. sgz5001026]|uniref:adhesin n=1 Tax=Ectobacillus sp. sgz5001026 TaxID=3242473 RepID=UPI0036D3584A
MIITDQAKTFIMNSMEEAKADTLRFTFAGPGCCGPNFGLALEPAQEDDITEVVNGIPVAIDAKVTEAVTNITLDFGEDEQGVGLFISGGNSCC